jgi:formate C-acetyltransferase
LNDSIKVNFARVFEVAFNEMMESECENSTEKLWELFLKHLGIVLDVVFKSTDLHIRTNKYNSPELFLNLFTYGPIEKGRDASDHSLDYYTIGVEGSAIAVAADSFAALQQRIEIEKRITWNQIDDAIKNNYKSDDGEFIQNLMKRADKFGQLGGFGHKWAESISKTFTRMVVEGKSDEGVQFVPALFSWSKTILFGQNVGATPDGRLAGAPVNHGANPMPGSVKNGEMTALSEAIVSVQCGRGNTAPFQMELDPGITKAQGGVEKIMALMETHLDRGGTLINVNIMNADKIRKANVNPELFPDLVVRVTGFTAYFITLSPEFRQLVVDRLMEAN